MKLHNDVESFVKLIETVSDYYQIDLSLIEKDYFVTLILKELSCRLPNLLFKGGTSLSKCYKIIDRFSEDIDLTLEENYQTQSQKKLVKKEVIETCKKLGLDIINLGEIRSRRDYNCYRVSYPIQHFSIAVNPVLLLETTYITRSYPSETKQVTSIIYDYLEEIGIVDIIEKYELHPFNIRVQTLERTLIDKVFAICDYFITRRVERNSRHIYDLYKLLSKVNLGEELIHLVKRVRMDRKTNEHCYSAQDEINIQQMLIDIIKTDFYREDYNQITKKMMYKELSYDEAIKGVEKIIISGIFNKLC